MVRIVPNFGKLKMLQFCNFEAGTEIFCMRQKEVVSMKALNRNKSRVCIISAYDHIFDDI